MSEPPGPHTTLEFYPWIVVRFACRACRAFRDKRLALLVEEFGAPTTIEYLLGIFIANCPHRPRKRNGRAALRDMPCGGYCPDLGTTRPPDLPPAMSGLTLIAGGKDDMLPAEAAPAERRRRVGGEE
ncbi:hypothetical protein IED13_15565 [Bosea sp. SSUT16]|uniref:Uncharacterized protein n=1 Tax=Bosea spartocytisi TaxID=2773451 RepID=A0A927EA67_9HYPH|nr:hypothetical protein [Bosea spartocytisi]MBD3847127.1 hypothetical protein [Bosea spartocytisi]MCT4474177.1 hypothetical protein [Bosea spartocytisi]